MRIKLAKSERDHVTISTQKTMPQARIQAGLVDRLGLFQQRPQQDARVPAWLPALSSLEGHIDSNCGERLQKSSVKNEPLFDGALEHGRLR